MSLQVFFDNIRIEDDYITELSTNAEMFNESFKLGQTVSTAYTLAVAKEAITTQPTQVTLKDNGTVFAILDVDDIKEDDFSYTYSLTDRMVDLEFYYDASQIFNDGSATLLAIALDICSKAGITLYTQDFRGYNKSISWYDNTRTAREYIGYIAELNGGYARIDNGQLKFIKQKTNSVKTISIDDCADFIIGEYHKITRVVYELGSLKYEFGNETNNTLYLNSENVFITTEEEVEGIYEDIKDFEFYSFTTTNCPIDFNVKVGETITFTDGTNNYPTITNYSLNYFGDWYGGYSLEINTERQEETKLVGDKQKIKNLSVKVDRAENSITQVIEEVDDQNTKISAVEQTVAELNSRISDIADITTSAESIFGEVQLDSVNASEPIYVKIRPTSENISYLYPHNNLFPSNTLYPKNRKLRFHNTTTDEVFDYELPDNLLTTGSVYDEFILGYDEQICQVNKKCQYKADGTVEELETERIDEYPYPSIQLTDGNYIVSLLGYPNAYLQVKLMAQNIYTTQFATKAELSSGLTQTAGSITAEVNQKLTNYSTTTQMNSAIQVKTNEINSTVSKTYETKGDAEAKTTKASIIAKINDNTSNIKIEADNIDINGIVTANQNFKILSDGSMEAKNGKFNGGSITLYDDQGTSAFRIMSKYGTGQELLLDNEQLMIGAVGNGIWMNTGAGTPFLDIYSGQSDTYITPDGITTPEVIQTSKESKKKNITIYNEDALNIVRNSQIYNYNFKGENENSKKHIGFVIGDEGGEYKTPKQVISGKGEGIDTYSMVSILWKAVQEQQTQIEQLQKQIKEMKGENNE